ncbi:hypothetical protein DL237_13775 [Pseudooceanicola sediminis]|uniref:Uncharacterized protein n=1 Tax=Pseudooceanicola sediminis TaxID=2211117 RepID=A0A399IYE9_9RHOB|nr:hypothetical protein DL237_13775 [Pseudooceanicola sediminis]
MRRSVPAHGQTKPNLGANLISKADIILKRRHVDLILFRILFRAAFCVRRAGACRTRTVARRGMEKSGPSDRIIAKPSLRDRARALR